VSRSRLRLALAAAKVAVAVALVAATGAGAAGQATNRVLGEQSVLVVLVTWGPQPFAREEVRRVVFGEVAAFLRTSSYGRASLTGEVTEWLRAYSAPPGCDLLAIDRGARGAARRGGYDPQAYDHTIYIHPRMDCAWSGAAGGDEAWLDGEFGRDLIVHELGHMFGLGHANLSDCSTKTCAALEYGDPYDVMGRGSGDFNAYEKFALGWVEVVRPRVNGVYTIAQLERASSSPHALVVKTAGEEYWLENRGEPARSTDEFYAAGVLVRTGPPRIFPSGLVALTTSNALIPDPAGQGRPAMLAGDRFGVPGAFAVRVVARGGGSAQLRFTWTDTAPPGRPRDFGVRSNAGELGLSWVGSQETGSGIQRYEISIDGGKPLRLVPSSRAENRLSLPPLRRGIHRVAIVAVDRAGNRGAALVRRFSG
jgi:hypothetical protein